MSEILVTGGAGFIGSHTVLELLEAGYRILVLDNFCNSHPKSLDAVKKLAQKDFPVYYGDVRDQDLLRKIFRKHDVTGVIHFAGLKAVGESIKIPLSYYDNNLIGLLHLLEVMREASCKNLIFSSSASVYGAPTQVPVAETAPLSVTNPYGRTKRMQEEILGDLQAADSDWNIVILRYFNPIGAHQSGQLGEDPHGVPNNLVPYVAQVAAGRRDYVPVFGDDYPTSDGTGIRDYIHVVDLSRGHLAALQKWNSHSGLSIYNLGTGRGYSVLEIIAGMSRVVGCELPYKIFPRRSGDIAMTYADSRKAWEELGWKTEYDLDQMCQDTWNWQKLHPNGFRG